MWRRGRGGGIVQLRSSSSLDETSRSLVSKRTPPRTWRLHVVILRWINKETFSVGDCGEGDGEQLLLLYHGAVKCFINAVCFPLNVPGRSPQLRSCLSSGFFLFKPAEFSRIRVVTWSPSHCSSFLISIGAVYNCSHCSFALPFPRRGSWLVPPRSPSWNLEWLRRHQWLQRSSTLKAFPPLSFVGACSHSRYYALTKVKGDDCPILWATLTTDPQFW